MKWVLLIIILHYGWFDTYIETKHLYFNSLRECFDEMDKITKTLNIETHPSCLPMYGE